MDSASSCLADLPFYSSNGDPRHSRNDRSGESVHAIAVDRLRAGPATNDPGSRQVRVMGDRHYCSCAVQPMNPPEPTWPVAGFAPRFGDDVLVFLVAQLFGDECLVK